MPTPPVFRPPSRNGRGPTPGHVDRATTGATPGATPGAADVLDPRATPEVVRDLIDDAQTLLRKEAELAKLEVTEAVRASLRVSAFAGAAAVLGLFTLGFAGATAAHALEGVLPAWGAWLTVTSVFGLLATAGAVVARVRADDIDLTPQATRTSIEEDVQWARRRLTS